MPRTYLTLTLFLIACCSSKATEPDTVYPVEGPIDVHVVIHPSEHSQFIGDSREGVYLFFTSRRLYPEGCYQFRTQRDLGSITLQVQVLSVFRPGEIYCGAVLAPASATEYLGQLSDGNYALVLADTLNVYTGILTLDAGDLSVVFPDTSFFNVKAGLW